MKKKHYLVYKTTCLLNGKIYIGQHQTYDPNDDYLGSGRELKQDIQNLGRENFKREILFDFDNFEDMDNKEKELVTEEFVAREDTYNVRLGGQNPEVDKIIKMGNDKIRKLWNENGIWAQNLRKKISNHIKHLRKERPLLYSKFGGRTMGFLGKHHTMASKEKLRIIGQSRIGIKNGSFGTVWIYNENLGQNKKVKKEQVETFLKQGWKLGRRMEFHK